MIKDTTLRGLAVTAVVLILASVWVGSRDRTVAFTFTKGQLLVPDLGPERVGGIEVTTGEEKVLLKRAGTQFLVESEKNYPASNREVNDLLGKVLDIRLEAEVSTDKDSFAGLGVDGGEKSTSISFISPTGEPLVTVITGKSEAGEEQYVRLASKDVAYRIEGSLWLNTKGLDYVDKQLAKIERKDVDKLVVAPAGGKVYTIRNTEDDKAELLDIPEGKKVKGSEPESVVGAVSYLNFENFMSASEAADIEFGNVFTVSTRKAADYRFEIGKKDEKWFVRVRAKYTGPKSISVEGADDAQIAKNAELMASNKAVEAFNARHESWVYGLPAWKATAMTKVFEDLVVDDDGKPEKVTASHILIPWQGCSRAPEDMTRTKEEAQTLAESLLEQVRADPAKLPELAAQESSCPSKEQGGDLGEFAFESMAEPFSEAAFALKVGEVCDHIVETEFGWHVIQRTK